MNPGDTIEEAVWLDGLESPRQVETFKADVLELWTGIAQRYGCALTPIQWVEKRPGDPRVPDVPPHIAAGGVQSKPDVRLLVGEAKLVPANTGNFLAELEPKDLDRLRDVVRRGYAKSWRDWVAKKQVCGPCPELSDRQCDRLINDLGPDAAVLALEQDEAVIQ